MQYGTCSGRRDGSGTVLGRGVGGTPRQVSQGMEELARGGRATDVRV